jgi:hypothetical protein
MKKLIILFVGILVLASCSNESVVAEEALVAAEETAETTTDSGLFSREGVKVSVCHKNAGEIVIDEAALNTHIAHGDAVDKDGDGFFDKENPCSDVDCDDNTPSSDNSCGPRIGDIIADGVVFWIDPTDNTKGLVCALSDFDHVSWCSFLQDLPSVPNVTSSPPSGNGAEIGDGADNTDKMLNDCPNSPSATAARSLGPEWFLPSINELGEMNTHKAAINATATANGGAGLLGGGAVYWSSTEYGKGNAWRQVFNDGGQSYGFKGFTFYVRAVRAF